jgi:hypothetical protein
VEVTAVVTALLTAVVVALAVALNNPQAVLCFIRVVYGI